MEAQKLQCQAIIVRFCPSLARGERLNIGVVLLSADQGFLRARFIDNWSRVTAAFPRSDEGHLREVARAVASFCEHYSVRSMPVEHYGMLEWVFVEALPDDGSILRSNLITGLTGDPAQTLDELFDVYVA